MYEEPELAKLTTGAYSNVPNTETGPQASAS